MVESSRIWKFWQNVEYYSVRTFFEQEQPKIDEFRNGIFQSTLIVYICMFGTQSTYINVCFACGSLLDLFRYIFIIWLLLFWCDGVSAKTTSLHQINWFMRIADRKHQFFFQFLLSACFLSPFSLCGCMHIFINYKKKQCMQFNVVQCIGTHTNTFHWSYTFCGKPK